MKIATIICPECKAEQAILRDDEGKMKCAFCGKEITDLPEYVEGEGLDYADSADDATEKHIEPEGDGIVADFILSEEEVGCALLSAGKIKKRKIIPIIEAVMFGLLGLATLAIIIMGYAGVGDYKPAGVREWIIMLILFGMIPVVFILPEKTKRSIVRNATSGNELKITVYKNVADVELITSESDSWQLQLDGKYNYKYENSLNILMLENKQILVIPDRAVAETSLAELHNRLSAEK